VKKRFSNAIKLLKSVKTLSGVYFKIKQPKPNYPSAIDEKTKNFSNFQDRVDNKTNINTRTEEKGEERC